MTLSHIPNITNCTATIHLDTKVPITHRQPEFEMTQALINTLKINITSKHAQLGEIIPWIDREKKTLQGTVELSFRFPPNTQLSELVSNLEGLIQKVIIDNLTIDLNHWTLDNLHIALESSNFTIPLTERRNTL